MTIELYYWPGIQGRGEFVRLALEAAGEPYVDVARGPGGQARMMRILGDAALPHPPFAPPFIVDGEVMVAQSANILLHLGPRLNLAPADEPGRIFTHQLQLTIADLVKEAHDTHHPVGGSLYYDDQKPEAARRAEEFREQRIPKFLGYFDRVLAANPVGDAHLVGRSLTYADLGLFQAVEGLRYAFPKAMRRHERDWPRVIALREAVAALPRIAAYLASDRRIAFNEDGIFRHYPELDG
ncbi:MAG TPA: glutathione S-transferase [Caulobacteraceae bacterium]|jgi:glutathione S-transferase|nr:glutathione S-transferase [Caulobacteraceae bacterium]